MDLLPSEILLQVFKLLPSDAVLPCQLVNRRFNKVIGENRKFMAKKRKKLYVDCIENGQIRIRHEHSLHKYLMIVPKTEDDEDVAGNEQEAVTEFVSIQNARPHILTNNVDQTLRTVLTFILSRIHLNMLKLIDVPSKYLKIVSEELQKVRCSVRILHLYGFTEPLDEETAKILDCAEESLETSSMQNDLHTSLIFDRDSVRKLNYIRVFNSEGDESSTDIGDYVVRLRAPEMRLTRPWCISDEHLAMMLKDWSTGSRVIHLLLLRVRSSIELSIFIQTLPFLLFPPNDSMSSIQIRSKNGSELTARIHETPDPTISHLQLQNNFWSMDGGP